MGVAPAMLDEFALVRRVVDGSEQALAALYDRHAGAIYAAAYRLTGDRQTTEEVVQETFLALWDRADAYDPGIGPLAAWLLAIARNRAVDRLRAIGRRPKAIPFSAVTFDDDDESTGLDRLLDRNAKLGGAPPDAEPEIALLAREQAASIVAALVQLADEERVVLELAYRDELTQSEIAERLDWPLGTVKTRTRRALRRLREMLGETTTGGEADGKPARGGLRWIETAGERDDDGSR